MAPDKRRRLARLKERRKFWLEVHLYLGLVAGLILVLTGVTGSLIAFGGEIDGWLNSGLLQVTVPQGGRRLPVDDVLASTADFMPAHCRPAYVAWPRDADRAVSVLCSAPSAIAGETDTYAVMVDPYAARVLGQRLLSRAGDPLAAPIMALLVDLHYQLLLGPTGALVVGIVSAALLISVLTGLIVWWPLTGQWRQALTVKWQASGARVNVDVHKTFGFYAAIVLIVILFSGTYMNLPAQVTPLVEIFSPAPGWPEGQRSAQAAGRPPISAGQAVAIVDRLLPDGELMGIGLPAGPDGVFVVRKRAPDEVTQAYPHRQVWLDQYDGRVLALNDPAAYTAGQKLLEWQYPLHSGEAFGLPGRILVLLIGLVCPILYVTGVIRWLQKRRAKRVNALRRGQVSSLRQAKSGQTGLP
jgi:uncharacterized iron-regulated membrane protein